MVRNLLAGPLAFILSCLVAPALCFVPGAMTVALVMILAKRLGDSWMSLAVLLLGIAAAIGVYLWGMGLWLGLLERQERGHRRRSLMAFGPSARGNSGPSRS